MGMSKLERVAEINYNGSEVTVISYFPNLLPEEKIKVLRGSIDILDDMLWKEMENA